MTMVPQTSHMGMLLLLELTVTHAKWPSGWVRKRSSRGQRWRALSRFTTTTILCQPGKLIHCIIILLLATRLKDVWNIFPIPSFYYLLSIICISLFQDQPWKLRFVSLLNNSLVRFSFHESQNLILIPNYQVFSPIKIKEIYEKKTMLNIYTTCLILGVFITSSKIIILGKFICTNCDSSWVPWDKLCWNAHAAMSCTRWCTLTD